MQNLVWLKVAIRVPQCRANSLHLQIGSQEELGNRQFTWTAIDNLEI